MKAHLLRRQSVNLAFRQGEALKGGHRFLFHPIGELAFSDQLPDLSEGAAMFMRVDVAMCVPMALGLGRGPVVMLARHVHIELHPFEARPASARHVQVITFEPQFAQLPLQLAGVNSQVDQSGDEHIAADAAD